ncbi:hypothetical protein [Candidatus Uabimicrobium amorphum]|uniref:Uncharacterized protein n=1 Tax=Uabimicrobium amorphum TaxID=2596890 RepID=A0A5S9IUN6_UABAM|nr:hypothetical protein [Candidatus Uabimicrobium amorphum]BBM87450.1 hypothetical protein UABAM_05859 [Candidatus Uabimicrobium amorphum]
MKTEIKSEFSSAIEVLKTILIFGGVVFAFVINICYLAIERDFAIKTAYMTLEHPHLFTQEEKLAAVSTLSENLITAKNRFQLVIHEKDLQLIQLYFNCEKQLQTKLKELLTLKLGDDSPEKWEKIFVTKFPRRGNILYMHDIENFILFYSWFMSLSSLIFLSQILNKQHVREYLASCFKKKRYFFPITTILAYPPILKFMSVWLGREFSALSIQLSALVITIVVSTILFSLISKNFSGKNLYEAGICLLILSLLLQSLSIIIREDMVYHYFGKPSINYLLYFSWFLFMILPVYLCEQYFLNKKNAKLNG